MIKTGRYDQIPRDRLCPTCGSKPIEDGIHLLIPILNTQFLETGFTGK